MDLTAETIAAPITAPGAAAVSVVRVSGPKTREVLRALSSRGSEAVAYPRTQIFAPILDLAETTKNTVPAASPVLDHALFTFFSAPHSFTGEDVAEFSLHGSPYLQERFLRGLTNLGVRAARPGEFTERAFLNGKLDLSQAEAVADLIAAETETQARIAREQLEGRLSQAISELGEPLRDLIAEIEAYIDFPDEGIEPQTAENWSESIAEVKLRIASYLDSYRSGRVCREGAQVVLAGLPNAGKSSLLNRIVGENRAIVTPIPGTTRDSIEERVSINGLAVRLWDTAGLPADNYIPDEVERIGIEQSWMRLRNADLVVFLFDGTKDFKENSELISKVRESNPKMVLVLNKCDEPIHETSPDDALRISARQGVGVSALYDLISGNLLGEERERGSLLICTARHHEALVRASEALEESLRGIAQGDPAEFIAVLIRSALGYLNEIIGLTSNDEILGPIFSKFCIGK